jgi:hypothetical protein
MSDSFTARIAARFSPLEFANVYGFPNTVPDIKVWEHVLPKFGEYADDNPPNTCLNSTSSWMN